MHGKIRLAIIALALSLSVSTTYAVTRPTTPDAMRTLAMQGWPYSMMAGFYPDSDNRAVFVTVDPSGAMRVSGTMQVDSASSAYLRMATPSSTQVADLLTAARVSGTEQIAMQAKLNALPRGGVTHWSTPFVASTTAGAFVVPCPSTSEIVAAGFSIIGSGTQYVYGGINQTGESGMNRIAAINAPVVANNLLMGYSCTITVDSQVDQGGVLGSVWAIWR